MTSNIFNKNLEAFESKGLSATYLNKHGILGITYSTISMHVFKLIIINNKTQEENITLLYIIFTNKNINSIDLKLPHYLENQLHKRKGFHNYPYHLSASRNLL